MSISGIDKYRIMRLILNDAIANSNGIKLVKTKSSYRIYNFGTSNI